MTLMLPEPAATRWKRHRSAIEQLAIAFGRRDRILPGGGTVLAARWRHRQNVDIHVLLRERESLNYGREGGPVDLAAATEGEHRSSTRHQLLLKVERGRLDSRTDAPLSKAHTARQKLRRSARGVTRKPFDIVIAATADPRGMAIAVNSFDDTETRSICHNLRAPNRQRVRDATQSLNGIPPEHCYRLQQIGDTAAAAVPKLRYTRVRVQSAGEWLEIRAAGASGNERAGTSERERASGNERAENYKAAWPRRGLQHAGIDAYVTANSTLEPQALQNTLERLKLIRGAGTAFDSSDRTPLERLTELRRTAGIEAGWHQRNGNER